MSGPSNVPPTASPQLDLTSQSHQFGPSDREENGDLVNTTFIYPARSLLGDIQPGPIVSPGDNNLRSWPGTSSGDQASNDDHNAHLSDRQSFGVSQSAKPSQRDSKGSLRSDSARNETVNLARTSPTQARRSSGAKAEKADDGDLRTETNDPQSGTVNLPNETKLEPISQTGESQETVESADTDEKQTGNQQSPKATPAELDPAAIFPADPFNLTEMGIVHLPPPSRSSSSAADTSSGGSSRRGMSHRISGGNRSSNRSQTKFSQKFSNSSNSSSRIPTSQAIPEETTAHVENPKGSSPHPSSTQNSKINSKIGAERGSEADVSDLTGTSIKSIASSEGSFNLATVRFQHVEDENGNHIIIGREGNLTRCEDEPIRTPGAIQTFGVLMVVQEVPNSDFLQVRQVSENSTELLGLSPKHLFSLECFTNILTDDQADVFLDNIQFLSEPDSADSDSEDHAVHVFTLAGQGQIGHGLDAPDFDQRLNRRVWTVWCAVHRPVAADGSKQSDLIVLEFELENDLMNPIYPAVNPPEQSTPDSILSESAKGEDSDRTVGEVSVENSLDGTVRGDEVTSTERPNLHDPKSGPLIIRRDQPLFTDEGTSEWHPTAADILESTTSRSKPIPALERMRTISSDTAPPTRSRRGRRTGGNVGMMDVFAVMGQINEQLNEPTSLETFLQVLVGVIKDLTQFHRIMVYQFDELWNGQVAAELVDWNHSRDLFRGLHFPATDIPAQARELYAINKVRLLYDRSAPTARIIVKDKSDLDSPLSMTHCYLRAMSPIHIKYLENMGVRASMSISIIAFGQLYGLIACHSYGEHRMRVSFPVRQMLRLLSHSISRNIERLSYAKRLQTRKLINTMASTDNRPSGYIVSNPDDLLVLFDADFGILVIKDGAKILGPNEHSQEILIMAEYLRLKQFGNIQVSQQITADYPELVLPSGLDVIAGLLYVPLSTDGADFIAFLRKGQPRDVHWAGKPSKPETTLEPRSSFKIWSEKVGGRCRAWTDEQMETAGVLALVYGKFIEVWRQKQNAMQATKMTNLLLSNASHEVRTPLNHIINYLELALEGPLDPSTRENLAASHKASKSLLFTINDLLDLARMESGNETSTRETFDLQESIRSATNVYRQEAIRRNLQFSVDVERSPSMVYGDEKKIKTVIANLSANALKYTKEGSIKVHSETYGEPEGLRGPSQLAVEIVVEDTGCGIPPNKLQTIFKEFEQVEHLSVTSGQSDNSGSGLGLGLAVVARIVEQLGGQLRVDSKVNIGSRFSFLIPLTLDDGKSSDRLSVATKESSLQSRSDSITYSSAQESLQRSNSSSMRLGSRHSSIRSERSLAESTNQINNLVEALGTLSGDPRASVVTESKDNTLSDQSSGRSGSGKNGKFDVGGNSSHPIRATKMDSYSLDGMRYRPGQTPETEPTPAALASSSEPKAVEAPVVASKPEKASLRVLVVEDNEVNLKILCKRLKIMGHVVSAATNGQEGLDVVQNQRTFDCILMDIQMPILDGYEATEKIRALEQSEPLEAVPQSQSLNNNRIPIFAVSASLVESRREEMLKIGMDGWILKPIDFKRLEVILNGVLDLAQRHEDVYRPGRTWEHGGWLASQQRRPLNNRKATNKSDNNVPPP